MLRLIRQKSFKKSLKKYRHNKQVLESLIYIVDLLVHEKPMPSKYKDHALTGKLKGIRELHLKPDDLLLYLKIDYESMNFECPFAKSRFWFDNALIICNNP